MPSAADEPAATRPGWRARLHAASPTTRGLLWAAAAGATFSVLNAGMRALTQQVDPMQSQFLRYLFGFVVLLPLVWRGDGAVWRPQAIGPHFTRGAVHTLGLVLWFLALPRIPLADMTAIGFTGPIFILIGAWLFLGESMRWERWAAVAAGFVGVLIVVGPKLGGGGGGAGGSTGLWHLVMLASAPVFAASFLLTKVMTRNETPMTILLWQSITVTLISLPLALWAWQWPSAGQWLGFVACGALGSAGHYCLTRSFAAADISATQSAKFLDLMWASLLGWLVFADVPTQSTLAGGLLICAATLWLARREAHNNRRRDAREARDSAAADIQP